ncbi:hypothetical protein MMC19_003449 [Ptychographa xylographoides]|nr:hypothetical protein [Ptychographa xylographoides]
MSVHLKPITKEVLDSYVAACAYIATTLRHTYILIGGAAMTAHRAPRNTEDVDIAVSLQALEPFVQAAISGRGGFRRYPDGTITWDSGQFFKTVECLVLEGSFVPWVPEMVGFREGYVATLPELVRLRALTLADRGATADKRDPKLLLEMCASRSEHLPDVDEEELGVLLEAMAAVEEVCEAYFMRIINATTLYR